MRRDTQHAVEVRTWLQSLKRGIAARDLDLGIVVARDCCYSARGNNNQFFMERVFPRMGRVMDTDDIVKLMLAGAKNAKKR